MGRATIENSSVRKKKEWSLVTFRSLLVFFTELVA